MDKPRARYGILEFTEGVLSICPYQWQRETLCHIEAGHPTALVAANGSGKTSTILVPAALWALFNWPLARVIVTSASWSQLKKQFFDTIRLFRFHPYFRRWTFNEAEIRTPEGGFIIGVSVDETGRAEGYHERPDSPVMILADEAKSIANGVFESLARCTATFRVYASSAGPALGTFYACLTTFRNFWACVLVKSSECPHISKESIELDRAMWGEYSPQFRQKHLAEFTAEDEEAFISMETVRGCMDNPPAFSAGRSSTFIDWSTGGDETVIATANGNRIQIVAAFRERDAVQCVRRVASILRERGLTNFVSADAGGIGGPMCAQLSSDFGIYAKRINNGSPARKKDEFANSDAEKWFAFRRLLEKREVILPVDGKLLKQLSSRRLQYDTKARIQLEPKELMRSRGLSSPDRADAVIGAAVMSLPGFTGSITMETLAGIQFGSPQGGRALFDFEPVMFE
jgi:hypothetical protein